MVGNVVIQSVPLKTLVNESFFSNGITVKKEEEEEYGSGDDNRDVYYTQLILSKDDIFVNDDMLKIDMNIIDMTRTDHGSEITVVDQFCSVVSSIEYKTIGDLHKKWVDLVMGILGLHSDDDDDDASNYFVQNKYDCVIGVRVDNGLSSSIFSQGRSPLIKIFGKDEFVKDVVDKYVKSVTPRPLLILLFASDNNNNNNNNNNDTLKQRHLMGDKGGIMMLNSIRPTPCVLPTSTITTSSNRSRKDTLIKKYEDEAVVTNNYMSMFPLITVLIVEDNIINRSILSGVLRKHKIKYKLAKNGKEAVDIFSKGGIHLIFMDLQLPVMSGIEAASKIRFLEKIYGISTTTTINNTAEDQALLTECTKNWTLDRSQFNNPVIIVALTASNSQRDKEHALMSGCNDYLTKPVNLVWLSNKLGEWGCMQALISATTPTTTTASTTANA